MFTRLRYWHTPHRRMSGVYGASHLPCSPALANTWAPKARSYRQWYHAFPRWATCTARRWRGFSSVRQAGHAQAKSLPEGPWFPCSRASLRMDWARPRSEAHSRWTPPCGRTLRGRSARQRLIPNVPWPPPRLDASKRGGGGGGDAPPMPLRIPAGPPPGPGGSRGHGLAMIMSASDCRSLRTAVDYWEHCSSFSCSPLPPWWAGIFYTIPFPPPYFGPPR